MSVKERLREFIKYKKLSERAFCLSIGVSTAFVSSMRQSIQPDKIKSIALQYPDLNTGWLLTGEGEMIKDSNPNPVLQPKEETREPVPAYVLDLLMEKDRMMHEKERELLKQNTALIEQNKVVLDQNKIVIEQNASLIETLQTELQEIKKAVVRPDESAGCADASGFNLVR